MKKYLVTVLVALSLAFVAANGSITINGDRIIIGFYDFGGAVSLELPNSATPTTDAAGEIALDTTIASHQPMLQYFDGGENMTVVAIDTAQLPALDNEIVKYDAGASKFVLEADANLGGEFAVQNEDGASHDVLPFLSAIELLIHPTDAIGDVSSSAGAMGFLRILRYSMNFLGLSRSRSLPSVGLMFGSQRMIPVKIRSIRINELAFDTRLNPVRASVEIVMDTLTERESKRDRHTKKMYESYMRFKVMLADTAVDTTRGSEMALK